MVKTAVFNEEQSRVLLTKAYYSLYLGIPRKPALFTGGVFQRWLVKEYVIQGLGVCGTKFIPLIGISIVLCVAEWIY